MLSLPVIPRKVRNGLLIGAALAATHTAAFGAGHLIAQRDAAEAQVVVEKQEGEKAVTEVVEKVEEARVERVERVVRDVARERQLQAELDTARSNYDKLRKAFNEKYDPDADVHLRTGDVRLLDDTATGVYRDAAGGTSDPSGFSSYEEQAPSDVSLRDFVGTELDIRLQYRDLATRHDALVDWVEDELIARQTPLDTSGPE